MAMKSLILVALGLICLSEVNALKCRNGFNLTLYDMPVYSWNEDYTCSSATDQSCFITEVKYSPNFLEGESVTAYYGSCVSTAYESYLECEQLYGESGTGIDQVANLFPDMTNQIEDAIMVFSQQLAMQINESMANFNRTEFVEELLQEFNVTVPGDLQETISQFEELMEALQNNSTNISALLENMFPVFLNQSIEKLEDMNITVSQESIDFIMNLHTAVKNNDTEAVSQMLQDLFPVLVNKTQEHLESMNITISQEMIDNIVKVHEYFSSNATMGNITFESIYPIFLNKTLENLEMMNVTLPDELAEFLTMLPEYMEMANSSMNSSMTNLQDILNNTLSQLQMNNITLSNETEYLLYLFVDLAEAIMSNNTENVTVAVDEIWSVIGDTYCSETSVTQDYADALYQQMADQGFVLEEMYKKFLRCIPGYYLANYPNKTEEINEAFTMITIAYNNMTEYVEILFKELNMTIPQGIVDALRFLELMEAVSRNETDFMTALETYINETAKETELSKLTITILNNNNVNVTYDMKKMIELQSLQFYYQNSQEITDVADVIFASLSMDLANNVDVGDAVVNAFDKTNAVNVSEEVAFILSNIQPVFDAAMNDDGGASLDEALRDLLVGYNQKYPNTQVELQIAYLNLRIELRKNNGTFMDEAVYEIIEEIFNLTLKAGDLTREEFKDMLKEKYPDLANYIEFLANFDNQELIELGAEFFEWFTDPNKNISTLSSIINETIHLVLERRNIDIRDIFSELFNPDSCRYKSCTTDSCNLPDILEDVTTTPNPSNTTTAMVETTTSGASTITTTGLSMVLLITSAFVSLKELL